MTIPNIFAEHGGIQEHRTSEIVIEKGVVSGGVECAAGDAKAHPWEMWSFHGASYNGEKTM